VIGIVVGCLFGMFFSAIAKADTEHAGIDICYPYPPEYPGCTVEQLRAINEGLFQGEYHATAYSPHYLHIAMGQHHQQVIHVAKKLNTHLSHVYVGAVTSYIRNHHHKPVYTTWTSFKTHSRYLCDGPVVGDATPDVYCNGWSWYGNHINDALNKVTKIFLGCNGFAATFGLAVGGPGGALAKEAFEVGAGYWEGAKFGFAQTSVACVVGGVGETFKNTFKPVWTWATDWWNSLGTPKYRAFMREYRKIGGTADE